MLLLSFSKTRFPMQLKKRNILKCARVSVINLYSLFSLDVEKIKKKSIQTLILHVHIVQLWMTG